MKTAAAIVAMILIFITVAHMEENEAQMIKDFKAKKEMQK